MPNPKEVAEIRAGGQRYYGWETVSITRYHGGVWAEFTFTVAEKSESSSDWTQDWSSLQLKPFDPVEVYLGGVKVIDGKIKELQTAFNAKAHGVMLKGESAPTDIHQSSAIIQPGGELKNVTLEAIANKVLQPFGFTFRIDNGGSDATRLFDRVAVQQGEVVFQFLERLCRQRGLWLSEDSTGRAVIATQAHGRGATESGATLEEGKNIKSLVSIFNASMLNDPVIATAPKGNDFARSSIVHGAIARNSMVTGYRPLRVALSEPGDAKDAQALADQIVAYQIAGTVMVTITVQGWFDPNGQLWDVGRKYTVKSPMARLNGYLWSARVTYTQNGEGGTETTLQLVNEAAFTGYHLLPSGSPNSNPMTDSGGGSSQALPLSEDQLNDTGGRPQAQYPGTGV